MKITIERVTIVVLVILLLFLSKCTSSKLKEKDDIITQAELDKQKLTALVNKRGDTIYEQKSIITSSQSAIKSLTDSIFDLKRKDKKNTEVIAYYRGRTTTRIDTLEISWVDTSYKKRFADSIEANCRTVINFYEDSSIRVPHTQSYVSKYIKVDFSLKKENHVPSLTINNLSIVDTLDLQFVERRKGLFKRKSIEVQFKHSNPYIKVDGSNSVFYKPKHKPKLFEKLIFIGAGIFIGTKL